MTTAGATPSYAGRRARGRQSQWGLRAAALSYLALMIVIPLTVLLRDGFSQGWSAFWHQITLPIAWHAIKLTLWTSALMTLVNCLMGLATAYVLVRYEFPGKGILNTLIDLPLSIPTLVTGVMLVILYGPQQSLGAFLKEELGVSVVFAPAGIVLALTFITLPFVVRSVQPILQEIDKTQERAAATLGASNWSIFWHVVFPALALPLVNGALLGFARATGEFGSVVIVAGNIPLYSQTAAVYVLGQVESENRLGASAISIALVAVAFSIVLFVNMAQRRLGSGK